MQDKHIDEYIRLRYTKDPIEAFNLFVKRSCPADLQAHFADSDDNEAEFVRRIITTEQLAILERLLEKKEKYDVGNVWSDEHNRFVNGIIEAVPLEAIQQQIDKIGG